MAADDWLAGYELSVAVGGQTYPFARVSYRPSAKMINRANSKYSAGFMINKAGIKSLTFTAGGPYKEGELPLAVGEEYTWLYKPAAGHVGFTFLGVLESMTFDNNVEDGPNVDVTVQNSADFDPVIS